MRLSLRTDGLSESVVGLSCRRQKTEHQHNQCREAGDQLNGLNQFLLDPVIPFGDFGPPKLTLVGSDHGASSPNVGRTGDSAKGRIPPPSVTRRDAPPPPPKARPPP